MSYATLQELEAAVFSEINAATQDPHLWKTIPDFDQAAIRIGKQAYPLQKIDFDLLQYLRGQQKTEFQIELVRIPRLFRHSIEEILPAENIDKWLTDKRAFAGRSGQDLLSELDPSKLNSNLEMIGSALSEVLASLIVPYSPTSEDMFYAVRLAQHEQLGLKKV